MTLLIGIAIGYFGKPLIDVGVKALKNAWKEYKKEN